MGVGSSLQCGKAFGKARFELVRDLFGEAVAVGVGDSFTGHPRADVGVICPSRVLGR